MSFNNVENNRQLVSPFTSCLLSNDQGEDAAGCHGVSTKASGQTSLTKL